VIGNECLVIVDQRKEIKEQNISKADEEDAQTKSTIPFSKKTLPGKIIWRMK
tara:strand:+ start:320 stop:475 length:156 start_codon:yes stop_codon:yes gene_type:complete